MKSWKLSGLIAAAVLAFAFSTVGCSSGGSNGAGGGSGTGGSTGTGGGSAGTGGGSAGTGGGTPNPKQGSISLFSNCVSVMGTDYCSGGASADFSTATGGTSPNCTISTVAGCQIIDCNLTADAGTPATITHESAGTITVGGTLWDGGIVLSFNDAGYDQVTSTTQKLWVGGETLTAAATGGVVPAFSKTVTAPKDITVTAPACNLGNCGTVSATAPLNVAWTGGGGTNVSVYLLSRKASEKNVTAICQFTSSPGTVATAVLAKLGLNSAGYSNTIAITPSTSNTFAAGSYNVVLQALGTGVGGTFTTGAGGTGGGAGGGSGGTGGGSGGTGGGSGGTGGGSGSGGGTGSCTAISAVTMTVQGGYDPQGPVIYAFLLGPGSTASVVDLLTIENYAFPTLPRTAMLPATTYAACNDCVTFRTGCNTMGTNCTAQYMAQSGTLTVNTATENATTGTFAGSAANLHFLEWDFASTPDKAVAGGKCVDIASVTFNATW